MCKPNPKPNSLSIGEVQPIISNQAALKKGLSIEYVSEDRAFTDADDYSLEIELPPAGCSQSLMNNKSPKSKRK